MDLFDFLDSIEKRQINLLRTLLHTGQTSFSLKWLKKELGWPIPAIEESIQLIHENMQQINEASGLLRPDKDTILLKTPSQFNFAELYSFYLTNSINYGLLQTILDHGKIVVQSVANKFFLSEASVFRRLKYLNTLLKEFGIQIKQGALIGPESQIRFFFFYLILNSYTVDTILKEKNNYIVDAFLNIMEKKYHYVFSDLGKVKLNVWGQVTVKRFNTKDKNFVNQDITSQLDHNTLYHAVKNAMFTVVSQYALNISENEIYSFYMFMTSMETLDVSLMEKEMVNQYFLDTHFDAAKANQAFMLMINENYPNLEKSIDTSLFLLLKYIINQLHHKIYFFQGSFYFFYTDSVSKIIDEKTYDIVAHLAKVQTDTTLAILGSSTKNSLTELIYRRYFDIILKIHSLSRNKIFIGINIHKDYSTISGIIYRLNLLFDPLYNLVIEVARKDMHYDLLITDSLLYISPFNYEETYLLNELETPYDIMKIKEILNEIYKEKN